MAHNKSTFINYEEISLGQFAYIVDGTSHAIHGIGDVEVTLSNGVTSSFPKYYIYHIYNVTYLAQASGTFNITGTVATLYNSYDQVIAICQLENDLYILGHSVSNKPIIQNNNNNISQKDE